MNLVCINCPRGCNMIVEEANGQVIVTGNSCPRGQEYAINELKHPLRTLTTTVAVESMQYTRLSVISDKPLSKEKLMEAVKVIKDVKIKAPVNMGQVIVENILGLGVNIVASKSITK